MGRPRKQQQQAQNRAVIYLRVSTDEQAKHGFGLDAQLAACEAYATAHTMTVIEVCRDEGISGTKPIDARPGLAQAFNLCELNQADAILTYAQDRLARSPAVFDDVRSRATRGKFRLLTARDGADLTAVEQEIPGDVLAMVASIERKLIARRLAAGRRERSKRDGLGSGFVPFGYQRTDDGIAVNPDQVDAIRHLFDLRSRYGYQRTADLMNAAGHLTPTGRPWSTSTVQGIERHGALYATGRRAWGDVVSADIWPTIL